MNKYFKNYLRLTFIALSVLGMQACYEDKGNYNYRDINEITFEGIDDSYTVELNGILPSIEPVITSSLINGSGDYKYEWLRHVSSIAGDKADSDPAIMKVAEGASLVGFKMPLNYAAGTYKFFFRVTDNNTGIRWDSKVFKVIVENKIKKGLLMMYEVDNETKMAFLNYEGTTDSTFSVMPVKTNALPALGKPISVNCFDDTHSPYLGAPNSLQYAVLVHTESGLYRLNHTDLSYLDSYNYEHMIIGTKPAGFKIEQVYQSYTKTSSTNRLLIRTSRTGDDEIDDILYYQKTGGVAYIMGYTAPINRVEEGGVTKRVKLSDKFDQSSAAPHGIRVFFDLEKGSFCFTNDGMYTLSYYNDAPGDDFDFNGNTNCEPLVLLMRYNGGGSDPLYYGRVYSLLKNTVTSDINLVSFSSNPLTKHFSQPVYSTTGGSANCQDIEKAEEYCITMSSNSDFFPLFYYRTDKEIFVYNTQDQQTTKVYPLNDGILPANVKISHMRVLFTIGTPTTVFQDNIAVFTYDGSKSPETCGSLEVFTIAPTYGTFTQARSGKKGAEVDMKWSGEFGKIISADWKNK